MDGIQLGDTYNAMGAWVASILLIDAKVESTELNESVFGTSPQKVLIAIVMEMQNA